MKLPFVIKILLFATALTPLVVSDSLFLFPFVFGKAVFYRGIIEIALILFLVNLLINWKLPARRSLGAGGEIGNWKFFLRSPLFVFTLLFFISGAISTALAPNAYRAFFGNMERGEGFFGVAHYLIFLLLALYFFEKKDWLTFFKILLGVGAITILYAWLQYFNVSKFPFALNAASQPGSFAGNPAYLSSYLILLFGVAAFLFFQPAERAFWRYASVFVALAAIPTIFITGIRGAILGLVAGILFLFGYFLFHGNRKAFGLNLRMIGAVGVLTLVLFSAVFWHTRQSPLWLSAPGFRRLATASFDNPSVATRLIALKVSFEAFKERPIFGWGPENYGIAYNKYFDPSYSIYAEDWFDRAHNRLADIAVMQGAFGLLAYFGLIISFFYALWKLRVLPDGAKFFPIFGAVMAGHFVQNLFLLDQITSYIPLFAIFGALIALQQTRGGSIEKNREKSGRNIRDSRAIPRTAPRFLIVPSALAASACVLYALYFWNYIPVHQALQFRDVMKLRVGEKILAGSDSFLLPYNFMQSEIRAKFVEMLYNSKAMADKKFESLTNKALDSLEEVTNKEPFEPRNYSRLIESYNERAKEDPSLFKKTEVFARKAVELSPARQGLRYHLAFIMAGQGKYDEAIALARETLALEPRAAKSHYELAIPLMLAADEKYRGTDAQQEYRAEAEKEIDQARELGRMKLGTTEPYIGSDLSHAQYYLFLESDLKNIAVLYRTLGKPDKMADVLEVLIWFYPENKDYRYDAVIIYRALRDKEQIIKHARELQRLDPSLKDDMDVIIDLANKENWEILDTL